MLKTIALVSAPVLLVAALPQDADSEREAIERAVLDYAESYYEVKPEYVERSINKGLVKVGYVEQNGVYQAVPMDYDGFMRMVDYFKDGNTTPPAGPKDVVVLDALDQTALVKLTGSWGTDYMQLAKFDGRWQTRHVVWQSAPVELSAEEAEADREAILRAGMDYIEAFYDAKPELAKRSVHPEVAKLGFGREAATDSYRTIPMSYDQLIALATEWNASGDEIPKDAPRGVELIDAMNRTACIKITAMWGVDYVNLAKLDGKWQILHVLWQSTVSEGSNG